jgi:hypothetical protein
MEDPMKALARVGGASLVAVVCGWLLLGSVGQAGEGKDPKVGILKIAELHQKGNEADAKTQAKVMAKGVEDMGDVMELLKPRKGGKGGLGVGTKPGAIRPDGIEQMIMALARDGITPEKMKTQAKALERMAYVSAAVMDVALAKPPEKDEGSKTIKLWNESAKQARKAALELAKAARSDSPAEVRKAAGKLNAGCNNCHNEFRQ